MEEHYDGDTVELIDYLRVMWWGKWIILGCFIIAIGLSILLVGLKPTTYSGSTEILLREYVTAALPEDCNAPIILGSAEAQTLNPIVAAAMNSTLAAVERAVSGTAASLEDNRITLLRSGASSPDNVREALVQAVVALEQQLLLALAEELKHLAYETRLQKTGLTGQLEILQQRLGEELTSGSVSLAVALTEQIAGLDVQLSQKQVLLNTLETTEPGDLYVLTPIGEPKITATTPASKLKTTVAVAGFLGLMIGLLMAFFVHYLIQIRERERSLRARES